ncbi:MAG: hypothetical protein C0592_08785 [Marinilabiliales bacterium]|nr:MAG: hypothetical protein C0592_08785 [Marinilabiliales bacterium]
MKKTISYLLFMGVTVFLSAQSIQNDVVSSAGASGSSATMKIDYTVGEPVIELRQATTISASQGFHQPGLYVTAIDNPELEGIQCYPNPVDENLIVDIPASYTSSFVYTIYDLNGRVMVSETIASGSNAINMKSFAAGNYLLYVTETSTGKSFQSKILKVK